MVIVLYTIKCIVDPMSNQIYWCTFLTGMLAQYNTCDYFHILELLKPISRRQILDSSKLKEFADDNFKFDENGSKLSKWVENTVGKGEIARYEQFLLFPQCFHKACFPGASKGVIEWEWVNYFQNKPLFLHRVCSTNLLKTKSFVGNGETY